MSNWFSNIFKSNESPKKEALKKEPLTKEQQAQQAQQWKTAYKDSMERLKGKYNYTLSEL